MHPRLLSEWAGRLSRIERSRERGQPPFPRAGQTEALGPELWERCSASGREHRGFVCPDYIAERAWGKGTYDYTTIGLYDSALHVTCERVGGAFGNEPSSWLKFRGFHPKIREVISLLEAEGKPLSVINIRERLRCGSDSTIGAVLAGESRGHYRNAHGRAYAVAAWVERASRAEARLEELAKEAGNRSS